MDRIEANIDLLLKGNGLPNDGQSDYTLDQQIEELASKGVASLTLSSYKPVLKKSVTYIVAAVIINDQNEILMIQEAKSSCAGSWYLPAGRMEPGESIDAAAKREVLEETGLEFEPHTLIAVESAQGTWARFVLTGEITGGELKTVARADSESLQASWIDNIEQLTLRARDIQYLIEKGREYKDSPPNLWHGPILPCSIPHKKLLLRLVVVIRKKTNNRLHVLVSENAVAHLPICEIYPNKNIHSTMKKYMQMIFGDQLPPHRPHGILNLEHKAIPEHDGMLMTVLISCKVALESLTLAPSYTWLEISKRLESSILERATKNMSVALHVIQ